MEAELIASKRIDYSAQEELPTPEEIRLGCLEVQATWTPEERSKRACGVFVERPSIRVMKVNAKRMNGQCMDFN